MDIIKNLIESLTIGVALYKIILDNSGSPSGYTLCDSNPCFDEITGLKKDTAGDKNINNLITAENAGLLDRLPVFGDIALNGGEYKFVFRASLKNRLYNVIVNSPGRLYFSTVLTDITDCKDAEALLAPSEYKIIFDQSSELIWQMNSDGIFLSLSPSWEALTGYKPDSYINKSFSQIIHPDDVENIYKKIQELISTKEAVRNLEYRIKHADGSWHLHISSGNPVIGADGNIVSIVGVTRDVTEQKKIEEELRKSRQTYHDIYNSVTEAIYIMDENGTFIDVNKGAELMYGYSKEEMIGKSPLSVSAPGYNDINAVMKKCFRTFISGKAEQFEFWGVRKNGEIFLKDVIVNKGKYFGKDVLIVTARDITDRKKFETALTESEIKYRNLFDSNKDGILIFYIEDDITISTIMEANNSAAEIAGCTKDEIIGLPVSRFESELTPEITAERIKEIREKGSFNYETVMCNKEGRRLFVDVKASIISYNNRPAVMCIFRDITRIKQDAAELKERESFLNTLIDAIPVPVFYKDRAGNYQGVNTAFKSLLGTEAEHYLDKNVFDIHPPELASLYNNKDKELYEKAGSQQYETLIEDANGDIHKVIMNKAVFMEESGDFKGIVGTILDITERKKAEEALMESEERLFTLINATPDIICFKDGKGRWLIANKADLELFSLTGVDYYGRTDSELADYTLPFYRDAFKGCEATDERAWQAGVISRMDEIIPTPDGTSKIYDILKIPVFDHTGRRKGLVVLGRDITDRKKAEEELAAAHEKLVSANKEKDKFFSILAHDLRSPFNGFLAGTKILAEEIPNLSMRELQEIASAMQNSAEDLFKLLENLLEWSRIQRGLISFELMTVEFKSIVSSILNLQSSSAGLKSIAISNCIPENLFVDVDINMINIVIRNLISNAIKFTPNNGQITVNAKESDDFIEVSVSDTGIGIPERLLSKLFILGEKTSRKGTNGESSSGIGLILSKEYIEKHKGSLWVESTEGKGSTFYFKLPHKR
jgi:PAS domain S-box-containing protein